MKMMKSSSSSIGASNPAGCFGIKGCVLERTKPKTIRLIKCDGLVRIYDRPIKAWEVMEEYPKHMVCSSDSIFIGQKIPALSQHDRLRPGYNYFLLPANFFQSVLSFTSFLRCQSTFGLQSSSFEIEKTPSGSLRIKISQEFINMIQQQQQQQQQQRQLEVQGQGRYVTKRIITTPRLHKDYEQLVILVRRHHWKPKLDTIAEKNMSTTKKKKKKKKKKSLLL